MSLRNIRKCYGVTGLPPPEDDADDFEPSYAQRHTKSLYAGLEVSSNSESEAENSDKEVPEATKPELTKKNKNKKKKKQRKQKEKNNADKTDSQDVEELDDIDRSLLEVNAMLGAPVEPIENKPLQDLNKARQNLFTVRQQYLEADSEMRRRFGPDDEDDKKKRGRQPNLRSIAQRGSIIKTDKIYKKCGLSMTIVKRENDLTYFAYEHNKEYQRLHRTFLVSQNDSSHTMYPLEESQRRMHVEGLLETADRLYYVEHYTAGNKVIEEIIIYMQRCAHPFFSVTDIRTRLLYKHVENRAFHIAVMKYMHMLTNKACHRTALELGKLLLNLDPSDPLAVLFIIDSIAIRAGEYQWLIEAIDYWSKERDAGFLFNMMYSLALAEFHVARKIKDEEPINNKKVRKPLSLMQVASKAMRGMYVHSWEYKMYFHNWEYKANVEEKDDNMYAECDGADFEKADGLLTKAMLHFPSVVVQMLKIAGIRNSKINSCPLFSPDNNDRSSVNLKNLIALYAKFIWHKFLEEPAQKWFIRIATKIAEDYDTDQQMRAKISEYANRRMNLFQTYPAEIIRHLSILTPLSNLIVDGAVPEIPDVVSFDPEPPLNGVNRYERQSNPEGANGFFQFFTSMMPEHELMDAGLERVPDIPSPIRVGSPPPDPAPPLDFRIFPEESDDDTEDEIRAVNDLALLEALAPLADDDASEEGVTDAVRYFMNLYDTMFDGRFDINEGLRQFVNAVNRTSDSEEDSDAYILFTDPQVLEFDSDHDLLNEIQLAAAENDLPSDSLPSVDPIEHIGESEIQAQMVDEQQNDSLVGNIGEQAEKPPITDDSVHEQQNVLLEDKPIDDMHEQQIGPLKEDYTEQDTQKSKVNFVFEKDDDDGKREKQSLSVSFSLEEYKDQVRDDSDEQENQPSSVYFVQEDRRNLSQDSLVVFDSGATPNKQMKRSDESGPKSNANNNQMSDSDDSIVKQREAEVLINSKGHQHNRQDKPQSGKDNEHTQSDKIQAKHEFNEFSDCDDSVDGDTYTDYNGSDGNNGEANHDEEGSTGDEGDDMDSSDENGEDNDGDGECDDDDEGEDEGDEQQEGEQRKDGSNGDDDDNEDDDEEEVHMDEGDIGNGSDGMDAIDDIDDIDDGEFINNDGNANQNEMFGPQIIDDPDILQQNFMLHRDHGNPRNGFHRNRLQLWLQNGMMPLLLVPREFDVVGLNVMRAPAGPQGND